jgi:TfoX/Sxy family transcriptional regulator of competence genes
MAAQVDGIPAAAIERYDAVIATRPGIERKGASMPYTSTNGHMFSFLTPEGMLALRLSASDRKRFLESHPDATVEQHGRVLKEYVAVPDELFASAEALASLFALSAEYVASLRPKPPKR